ncbi:prephenate dehydratase [Sinomonas atrocyanea]|jgi:prephenate dehydratase|uniref:prephenate dehydratase n=1 Tax=Sinomonas atrocyanea TaxID=37927 RepID=UPI002785284C|nr:prephenate dehydratase [Sinomonas atrocyanea]MDQ0258468.1 prephenate dehydratase [Sinomonas atrocyanea]
MTTIAYQGEPGANSHMAALEAYPDAATLACATFEDAFAAVTGGEADLAMIPIDNTVAGRVADIHLLLPDTPLQIVGEHFLRIRFSLLGIPGATIGGAREVHSHVHALAQCRGFIREHGLTPVVAGDTAGSAREVAEWADPAKLSIAPPLAAERYGLTVLASDIEDQQHNTTRFVVLAPPRDYPQADGSQYVTSFVFRVRNIPAALYKALGGFATNGVNMTRLESYMVEGRFAATMFMVDVEGHPDEPALARALEELEFFSTQLRILGVFPAHPRRFGLHEG